MNTKANEIRTTSDTQPYVAIHARVVPHGLVKRVDKNTGKQFARATLLVSPGEMTGAAQGVPLADWPRAVRNLLLGETAKLRVKTMEGAKSALDLCGTDLDGFAFTAKPLGALSDSQVDKIVQMWSRSLWPEGAMPDWNGLATRLYESLTGHAVQTDGLKNPSPDSPEPDLQGADGQLAPNTAAKRVPAVLEVSAALSIGHANLAIALECQRAQALADSIRAACGVLVKKTIAPLQIPISKEAKGYDPAQYPKEITPQAEAVTKAVAKLAPRGADTLNSYAGRLAAVIKAEAWQDTPQEKVTELLISDKFVIAELRRKRKIAERLALFAQLQSQRDDTSCLYNDTIKALTPDQKQTCGASSWRNAAKTPALCALQAPDFTELTLSAQYANWPQYRTANDPPARSATATTPAGDKDEQSAIDLEQALRAFFTMQSTPSLARAFCLAVEIEIESTDLIEVADYGQISLDMGEHASTCVPRNWTLFRHKPLAGAALESGFWPVTRAEAEFDGQRDTTRHYGGLMVMGFGASASVENHVPRFDITSLDIRTALELETQRRSIKQAEIDANDEADQSQADEETRQHKDAKETAAAPPLSSGAKAEKPPAPPVASTQGAALDRENRRLRPGINPNLTNAPDDEPDDEGDRQDVGLTLLDRGLLVEALHKMATKAAKCGAEKGCAAVCAEGVVIDAEDLTTGYRLYVGTPGPSSQPDWYPLMARSIKFGTSGPDQTFNAAIESVLTTLIGKEGSEARVALESAMMNMPGRMLPKERGGNDSLKVEAVFEEAIAVWDGSPMGVDCSEPEGQANTTGDALIFGRTLSLPDKGNLRPPRLRYGQPYRFAMAAVFSSGHSVPQSAFPMSPDSGDTTPAQDLYYPSKAMADAAAAAALDSDIRPYVRALRQAKIAAPQVLLPEGHAIRANGPMGPEQNGLMVIRSLDADSAKSKDASITARATPKVAQRLVLVPSIPQARAVTHTNLATHKGVFDRNLPNGAPHGAYERVRQRQGDANFPAVRTSHLTGLNGRQHFDDRRIIDNPDAEQMATGESQGGAVFATRGARHTTYYPDPAADMLAARLYIKGRAGHVTMRTAKDLIALDKADRYPELVPVVISLRPDTSGKDRRTEWAQFITKRENIRFNPAASGDITGSGVFKGTEIALNLAPHEWVDLEMWFVPCARRLARDFSVLQTLATDLAQKGKGSMACCASHVVEGAMACLPESVCGDLAKAITETAGRRAYFGPGGVASPPMGVLLALAEQITAGMISHPMPEISALSRLSAVNAANRPLSAPIIAATPPTHFNTAIASDTCTAKALRAWRPSPDVIDLNAGKIPDKTLIDTACICAETANGLAVAEAGSTQLVMSGEVILNLNQIDTIEVRADMVLPGSTTFDDKLRGRSLSHRKANWWPLKGDPRGAAADTANVQFLTARSLFGFEVDPDGKVTLDRASVTLLRAERLPRPGDGVCDKTVSLRALFEGRDPNIAITERHIFPDGKARRMMVHINALPRTAEFMRTVDRRARAKDPWLNKDGPAYQIGDLVPGESLPAKYQIKRSDPVEVILPATIRPAKPDAVAPEPGFRWEPADAPKLRNGRLWRRRSSVLRIPLGREWYSSGEDEKLGIVLWPPDLRLTDSQLLDNDALLRRDQAAGGDRIIELDGTRIKACAPKAGGASDSNADIPPFEDQHLGPGGRYVSRWGADPVREGLPHKQIFLAPQDFPDLMRKSDDVGRAELVPNVQMPLSDEAPTGQESKAEKTGAKQPREDSLPPMMVSLLVYTPRFDAKAEEWYVEVELADSPAAETMVRFGLVRYQPHTRPDLRCSRPVEQYVQPMPCRDIEVWRREDDAGWRVRMCGPTFYRRRLSDLTYDAVFGDHAPNKSKCADDVPGVVEGAQAAPRMALSIRRKAQDAAGRLYEETIALPVPAGSMGTDSLLLRPLDHDTSALPSDHVFKKSPGAGLAARVLVDAAVISEGHGIWVATIEDSALGSDRPLHDLHILVEEVEAFEPDDPITLDERDKALVLSIAHAPGDSAEAKTAEAGKPPPPTSLAPSFDLGGPRFMGDFELNALLTTSRNGNP